MLKTILNDSLHKSEKCANTKINISVTSYMDDPSGQAFFAPKNAHLMTEDFLQVILSIKIRIVRLKIKN